MTRVRTALLVIALAACRSEPTVDTRRTPLEPSGNPVAKVERDRDTTRDDRTATQSADSRSDSRSADSRSRDSRSSDSRSSVPPPLPPPSAVPPPPPPPLADDELPPSLLEGANGGTKDQVADKTDKRDKRDDKSDKADKESPMTSSEPAAAKRIAPIRAALCVTTGAAAIGGKIEKPAMRAVAKGTDGDAASMTFTFHGETATTKKLSSGETRRQIGLKLRAENGCNLIYVMWRLDPKPMIYAQVKRNPGDKDHKACGAGGYKKIKAALDKPPPELVFGEQHTLRAQIVNNATLEVFIDNDLHWRGSLPDAARDLRGPAGIRSDNLAFDLVSFDAAATTVAVGNAKCVSEDGD